MKQQIDFRVVQHVRQGRLRRRLRRVCTGVLALCTMPALAQNSRANWVTGPPADAIWRTMAQAPYAQEGDHGFVIYMLSYSACPNCINFLRDFWQAHRTEIQLREIFAPVSSQQRFMDEAADIALTRSAASANAYYHRSAVAPPINTPQRRAALNQSERFIEQMNGIYRQFGHIPDGYPTFIFRVQEGSVSKLYMISGWGGADLTQAMTRWVAAGQSQAQVP